MRACVHDVREYCVRPGWHLMCASVFRCFVFLYRYSHYFVILSLKFRWNAEKLQTRKYCAISQRSKQTALWSTRMSCSMILLGVLCKWRFFSPCCCFCVHTFYLWHIELPSIFRVHILNLITVRINDCGQNCHQRSYFVTYINSHHWTKWIHVFPFKSFFFFLDESPCILVAKSRYIFANWLNSRFDTWFCISMKLGTEQRKHFADFCYQGSGARASFAFVAIKILIRIILFFSFCCVCCATVPNHLLIKHCY